jgi:hypothetical protein
VPAEQKIVGKPVRKGIQVGRKKNCNREKIYRACNIVHDGVKILVSLINRLSWEI